MSFRSIVEGDLYKLSYLCSKIVFKCTLGFMTSWSETKLSVKSWMSEIILTTSVFDIWWSFSCFPVSCKGWKQEISI